MNLNRSKENAKPPVPNAITLENEITTRKCAAVQVSNITWKRAEKNQAVKMTCTKLRHTNHAMPESHVTSKTARDEFAMFDKGFTMTTQREHKATQITNLSLSIKILRELYST